MNFQCRDVTRVCRRRKRDEAKYEMGKTKGTTLLSAAQVGMHCGQLTAKHKCFQLSFELFVADVPLQV